MATPEEITGSLLAALGREPRIGLHRHPVHLSLEDGVLVMEGEVGDVVAKKLSLELAAATPGVTGIVDRLHVVPAQRMPDGAVRDHVCHALVGEPTLRDVALWARSGDEVRAWRARRPDLRGGIEVRVEDGVVTLDGEVTSLAHKRLAGVLAWWVPGARDVVNGLGVEPREHDSDEEMTEAVRVALEKDPFVEAGNIQVVTLCAVVTLSGAVSGEDERHMAEMDAWYVFGVDRVDNRLVVLH